MAELLLGPFLSMVKDKASSYLLDEYEVMQGMEEQHETLKRKLPAILDIIADAEEEATSREGPKAWLEALKKVAYDANKVFDEFKYEALRRQAREEGHYGKLGLDAIKIFPTHNRVVFRYRMGNKLRRIVHTIEILVSEMNTFRFKFKKQGSALKERRQTDSMFDDSETIISQSRDAEKQKIINILKDAITNATTNLTVLPIVGMGGLGKTTLARFVFNDPQFQNHFQHKMWLCESDLFDVYDLVPMIYPVKRYNKKVLQNLKEKLTEKRYLLILDDFWNRDDDKWKKLKACLQYGATGSVILVTTRFEKTAQIMGTVGKYDVTGLDKRYIKKIIENKTLSLQQRKPELFAEVLNMVDKFAERCCGSPLAAKALGALLDTKESREQWEVVLNKSAMFTEESEILQTLKLSYDDLPSHMKQCFAFCAVFPKDYQIDVQKLIHLWISNGFIQALNEDQPENIGKHVFNELASRSFFQDVKTILIENASDIRGYSITTCTIHDLMHDLAMSIKGKKCVAQTEKPSRIEWLPDTTHHLFLSCYTPDKILNDYLEKGYLAIQTLLCDSAMHGSLQHLSKYSSMQALQLCQTERKFLLKAKHLHHLRYLDLSRSGIEVLPEDITILYNLQILNLSKCENLRRLPRQMKYMSALRHLYTHGCPKLMGMPPGLRKVTSLQTLTSFVAGRGSDCCDVGEMQSLGLRGQLEIRQLENVAAADAKAANLGDKKELAELTLRWTSDREEEKKQQDLEVLECLTSNDKLQVLCIYYYGGTTFPKFIGMLENMVELILFGCDKCEKLPFCDLPALQVLRLEELPKLRWLCDADAFFNLPNLKKLKLKMLLNLERWWEIEEQKCQEVIFPHLVELVIINCGKLTGLPGQQTFPELKSVLISGSSKFTTIPEAPKLSVLDITHGNLQMYLCAAKCMDSLTKLELGLEDVETSSSLEYHDKKLKFVRCNFLFTSNELSPWTCFVKLQELHISDCDELEHWPEKEFQSLVSLVTLEVKHCKNLTGYKSDSERIQLLPRLQTLEILNCFELVELLNVPGSIKELVIESCPKIILSPSTIRKQQGRSDSEISLNVSPSSLQWIVKLEKLHIIDCDELEYWPEKEFESLVSLVTLQVKDCKNLTGYRSDSERSLLLPRLQTLEIIKCVKLVELLNVPGSIKNLVFKSCPKIILSPSTFRKQQGRSDSEIVLKVSPSSLQWIVNLWELCISKCDVLVTWPEREFECLVSLVTLKVKNCKNLTGYAPEAASCSERNQVLPRLQCLEIIECGELVEVLNVTGSITRLVIESCPKIILPPSIFSKQQGRSDSEIFLSPLLAELRLDSCETLSGVLNVSPSSLKWICIENCKNLESIAWQLDASTMDPCTRPFIIIDECDSLTEVLGIPPSVITINIYTCSVLRSLQSGSRGLPVLENLYFKNCKALASLPDDQQSYSSLQYLEIRECPELKTLPTSLQQRLSSIAYKELDVHLQEPKPEPTWKYSLKKCLGKH